MTMHTMSIILYAAFQTMQPCEKVFVDTAKSANASVKAEEMPYLEEFAKAACATSNPDILWTLGLQETNFKFVIIRENRGKKFSIKEGAPAIAYLKTLKKKSQMKNPPKMNVDIGVMQFNWHWHGEGFNNDPMLALSPKRQVDYFVEKYSREIYKTCDQDWVGCFHNQSDDKLSTKYQSDITKKMGRLANNAVEFMVNNRARVNGDELEAMPAVVPDDFYKTFAYAKSFPRPQKKTSYKGITELASK
ncbi:MAG: hypothetical protein H7249_01030 [Chitinophagaceae bacterium]|nr:hypothetical protein [Oligoflexus sp.]